MILASTHIKQFMCCILINFFIFNATSQSVFPPDSLKQLLEASAIESKIKIDGILDEAEWILAYPVPDFIQMDPFQGLPAIKKTVIRILYNKQFLYVSAVCYDTVGKHKYRVPNFRRDFGLGTGDDFSIAIDGYNDERNAVSFSTNPYSVQSDLLSFDDNYYDIDWDGLWIVRTQRTDTAWTAEMAIPWKTLRYKKSNNNLQTWGISFSRMARTNNELSSWPAFPRAYSTLRMPYAAKLINIDAPTPSTNIRLQPYSLYAYNIRKEDSKVISSGNTFRPGGDLKWAVSTNSLLDLTFNTDFAQADVDRKVNNINRFSVFFPERRQFFLENAGLFTVGIDPLPGNGLADYSARIQPFFSRTIGLDANGSPVNIIAGARLVSRNENRNIGGLIMLQEGNQNTNPAYYFAGRYSKNYGKQNRVGVLLSYKADEEEKSSIAVEKNFTATIDGFQRFNQLLSLGYMISLTNGQDKNANGYAAGAQLIYNSNTLYAWWNQSVNSEHYTPKMGFVARQNVIISEPGLYYQIRAAWLPKFIRAAFPGISYITYHNTKTGKLTDRYFNFIPVWIRFQNRSLIFYNGTLTLQHVENNFMLLGTQVSSGVYDYTRHKFGFSSDQSKKIAITVTGNLGNFYNGQYNALSTNINFAPTPHFFISPGIEKGKLKNFGSALVSKDVTLYTLEGRLALNPRLQATGLFQKSSITNSMSWNARFSWEYAPLSFFYIVFNKSKISETVQSSEQQLVVKLSYLKQL